MSRKNRKNYYILFINILFIIAMIALLYFFKPQKPSQNSDSPIVEPIQESNSQQQTPTSQQDDDTKQEPPSSIEKPKSIQYDGENPNERSEIDGVITYADVINNDTLMIRVSINQYLSSGKCNLNIIKDGDTKYSASVRLVPNVATSTCEGFNIPLSQINATGVIKISISISSEGKTGLIEGETTL